MEQNITENHNDSSFEYDDYEAMNQQPNSNHRNTSVKTWNKQEKIVIIGFGIVSALVLILGFLQFNSRRLLTADDIFGKQTASSNFGNSQLVSSSGNLLQNGTGVTNSVNLSLVDTDKDGISDADELSKYGTSPYLDDSDSDGVKDKDEIDRGENPNCPQGKTCGYVASKPDASSLNQGNSSSTAGSIDFGLQQGGQRTGVGLENLSGLEQSLLTGSLSGQGMRDLLQQQGAPADLLDQVSDEQLEEIYKKSLGQVKEDGLLNQDGSVNPVEAFTNLSPEQIRILMIQGGMDEETVNGLSDDEVNQIYQETLSTLN